MSEGKHQHPDAVAAIAADVAAAAEAAADKVYSDAAAWMAKVREEWPGAAFIAMAFQRTPATPEICEQAGVPQAPHAKAMNTQAHISKMERHEVFVGIAALLLHLAQSIQGEGCQCGRCQKEIGVATEAARFLVAHGTNGGKP